jgi:hypothetical protein
MVSRKSHRKHKSHRRRRSRKEGGAMLNGAPLAYHLAGDWSSKMSLGQGGDYLKYHVGQHGGALGGAPVSAIENSSLPSSMHGPAMQNGPFKAYAAIAGLRDQAGGKRRKRSHKNGGSRRKNGGGSCGKSLYGGSRRKRSHKNGGSRRKNGGGSCGKSLYGGSRRKRSSRRSRRTRRSNGGALGYSSVSANPMLLSSAGYAKAGMTPEWKGGVEFDAAAARQAM